MTDTAALDAARADTAAAELAVNRITAELEQAERSLAELEGGRGAVVHANGDVAGLGRAILEARELITTLTAGLSEARSAYSAAADGEAVAELEAERKGLSDGEVEELEAAYETLGELLGTIADLGPLISAHEDTITHFNDKASRFRRPDLVLAPETIRERAKVALGGLGAAAGTRPSVARQGESDEVWLQRVTETFEKRSRERPGRREDHVAFDRRAPGADFARAAFVARNEGEEETEHQRRQLRSIVQHLHVSPFLGTGGSAGPSPEESEDEYSRRLWAQVARKLGIEREGESDEAYLLRRLRAAEKAQDRVVASNPLVKAGERAILVIQQHALGLSPHERNRRHPRQISQASLEGREISHPDDLVLAGQRSIRAIRALRG